MSIPYKKDSKFELLDRVGFKKHFQGASWEDYNRAFFNQLAPKYDSLNQVLSFRQHLAIKKATIRNAEIPKDAKILDVCTGSGDVAIFLAESYPDAEIIAVDVSDKMLHIAREKSKHLSNVRYLNMDALHLDFEDGVFDRVFISFGLRNLIDLKQGLKELKRVTKKGGLVSNLDLGKPKNSILRFLYCLYFEKIIPFLGATFFHRNEFNSFSYLPESNKHFPDQRVLCDIFKELSFQEVKSYDFIFGSISQQVAKV